MKMSSALTAKAAAVLLLSTTTLIILTPSSPSSPWPSLVADAFQPSCRRHYGILLDQIQHQSTTTITTSVATPNRRFRRRNSNRFDTTDVVTPAASSTSLFSSIGGDRPPPPPSDDNNGSGGDLGDFLDPMRKPDSDNLKRARQFMSETSLPLSFDTADDDEDEDDDEDAVTATTIDTTSAASSSLTSSSADSRFNNSASSSALFGTDGSPPLDLLAKNPYMQVVSKISPSDVIAKFTATADPRVQEAVRTTILGLIGSLPKMAFETTSITTGQRLASLMFQLQMTGYMFKNAEYRMSMSQSLGMYSEMTSNLLLTGSLDDDDDDDEVGKEDPLLSGKIKGKLRIRYGEKKAWTPRNDERNTHDGSEIEVDAAAYMSELRSEVAKLRDELVSTKEAKEEALRKDLLLYIRTLPAQELKSLTNTMSQEVLVCMKGLVQAVLAGIGDGQIGPDTVTEQSGEAMAQLCMWQLAVGYNLRELEVREEMKRNLETILGESKSSGGSRNDTMEPGAFE